MKKITFHEQTEKPKDATTIIQLAVLHPEIEKQIKAHIEECGGEWLQRYYYMHCSHSYLFLYTDNGNRIDVWL